MTTLELDLADGAYGLQVTLYYRVFDGFDVLERWAAIRHRGDRPAVIRQALSANWWLPAGRRWRLRYLHGGWAAETQLTEATLGPGKLVLESRRGTTGHHLNPWFTLDPDGASAESGGPVWSGALAWSGSWKLVFETTPAGRVHACGGVNDFDWAQRLAPGEELVLPAFAALHTAGGFGAASREWHAWQRAHVLGRGERAGVARPRFAAAVPPAAPAACRGEPALRPVLYNSWEATGFAVSEAGQARLAERAAQLGVECFVVDDGWFAGPLPRPGRARRLDARPGEVPPRPDPADRAGHRARACGSACGSSPRWSTRTATCTARTRTGCTTSRTGPAAGSATSSC